MGGPQTSWGNVWKGPDLSRSLPTFASIRADDLIIGEIAAPANVGAEVWNKARRACMFQVWRQSYNAALCFHVMVKVGW